MILYFESNLKTINLGVDLGIGMYPEDGNEMKLNLWNTSQNQVFLWTKNLFF